MTDSARRRLPRGVRIRIGYLLAGIPVGALWLLHAGESPWQHALRLVILMAIVMGVSSVVRLVASRRGRRIAHPPVGKFLLAKAALILLAVFAGIVLQGWIANADWWIGLGLIAVVAVVGPMVHPWLTDDGEVPSGLTRAEMTA